MFNWFLSIKPEHINIFGQPGKKFKHRCPNCGRKIKEALRCARCKKLMCKKCALACANAMFMTCRDRFCSTDCARNKKEEKNNEQ